MQPAEIVFVVDHQDVQPTTVGVLPNLGAARAKCRNTVDTHAGSNALG